MQASRSRFVRKKFIAFSKWKCMAKTGFPIFDNKKWYKGIIFELIEKKNERDLKEIPAHTRTANYLKKSVKTLIGMQRLYYYQQNEEIFSPTKNGMLFNSVKRLRLRSMSLHLKNDNKENVMNLKGKDNNSRKSVGFQLQENKTDVMHRNPAILTSAKKKPKSIIKRSYSVSKKLRFSTPDKKEKSESKKVNRREVSNGRKSNHKNRIKKKVKPPIPNFFDNPQNKRIRYPVENKRNHMSKFRPMDQIQFYSKMLVGFENLRLRVENSYRDFFFRAKMLSFTQVENNFKNRPIRGLR